MRQREREPFLGEDVGERWELEERKRRHACVVVGGVPHLSVFTLRAAVEMTVTVRRGGEREGGVCVWGGVG